MDKKKTPKVAQRLRRVTRTERKWAESLFEKRRLEREAKAKRGQKLIFRTRQSKPVQRMSQLYARGVARYHRTLRAVRTRLAIIAGRIVGTSQRTYARLRQAIQLGYTKTLETDERLAEWLVPFVQESVAQADREIVAVERTTETVVGKLGEQSETMRLTSEEIVARMPITAIDPNGRVRTKEGRSFVICDVSGLVPDVLRAIVEYIHGTGPKYPVKFLWEIGITGTTIAEHLKYMNAMVEKNRHLWDEFPEKPKLSFDTLYRWYRETCEAIRRVHRATRSLIVIPEPIFRGPLAELMGSRVLDQSELALHMLGLNHEFNYLDQRAYEEYQYRKVQGETELAALTPSNLDFLGEWIEAYTQSMWPTEDSSTPDMRRSYYKTLTIYDPAGVEAIKNLVIPHIKHIGRKVYVSMVAQPLSEKPKLLTRAMDTARKRMMRRTGWYGLPPQERKQALAHHPGDLLSAYKAALKERYFNYLTGVMGGINAISKQDRKPFLATPVTLIMKAQTYEDLEDMNVGITRALTDAKIWYEMPNRWEEQEELYHQLLPCITDAEASDRVVEIPQTNDYLVAYLFKRTIDIPVEGIYVGIFTDGTPISLDLGIIIADGAHGSGKTQFAKNAAALIRIANPGRRVIVIDNSGAAATYAADKTTIIKEASMRGWVQWAHNTGGKVVYAVNHKTPESLLEELRSIEHYPFIVYYPDQQLRKHDIACFHWLHNALREYARPDIYSERDVQQMVVFDDILSYNADPPGEENRMRLLTNFVLNQCVSTGTLAILTFPTAAATEKADPSSHEVMKTTHTAAFHFPTASFGNVPGALGMLPITAEGEALIQLTSMQLAAIAPKGLGSPQEPGRCVITMHNIESVEGQTVVHPKILQETSRKVLKEG